MHAVKQASAILAVCALTVTLTVAVDLGKKPIRVTTEVPSDSTTGPDLFPNVREDAIVVKLTTEAAERATSLPEYGLPSGVQELDEMLSRHGILGGRRAVRDLGSGFRDIELFEKIGLHRAYMLQIEEPRGPHAAIDLAREFDQQPWVEYAEPIYYHELTSTPNDPEFNLQWAHVNTGQVVNGSAGAPDADTDADLAWDTHTGTTATRVAVLDTGIDMGHLDLRTRIVAPFDFIGNDAMPQDTNGHGTGSCGIAAAIGDNGTGVAGACYNCSIIPLRVSSSVDEADAMTWAADNGAATYNMSHTFGAAWLQIVIDATEYATGLGSLGFASATNGNGYGIGTPAAYPEVVPVGGSNSNDQRVYAYSDLTDITAPGPNTRSTGLGGGYIYFGGTSSSSPYAAGLGALLRSHRPDLDVHELRYLLRLGSDDQVGIPSEDTPGWDQFMGYGRVNAKNSMDLIDGPWLTLDRPHYVCGGELTVALKDMTAGASVDVTLVGSVGGDTETVTVTPVAGATGYYEGTIPISWAGIDGPVVLSDGKLDAVNAETIDASEGGLAATAFMQCEKKVCFWELGGVVSNGDCDADGAMDPGEIWQVAPIVLSYHTEAFDNVRVTLETTNPDVTLLKADAEYGTVTPFSATLAGEEGAARVQVTPGASINTVADFTIRVSGEGWEGDVSRCQNESGFGDSFELPVHRDLGVPTGDAWDFDDGTTMGFTTEMAHGGGSPSGDLSECSATWVNSWSAAPQNDRSHSGSFSMRLGTGSTYAAASDAGLVSDRFTVPAGGGAISFYLWNDAFLADAFRAWDGMVVEAKRISDAQWTYLSDANYTHKQNRTACAPTRVPFGFTEHVPLFAGDGTGSNVTGDEFDAQTLANLSQFAGEEIQVRWRMGSHDFVDAGTHGSGVWVDTVTVHDAFVADAWSGEGPGGLAGADGNCDFQFDLSWSAVAGAGSYEIFRSETSCADAAASLTPYDTTGATSYSDTGVVMDTQYYYAIGATESVSGCPTVRSCIPGGCVACAVPPDPTDMRVGRDGGDVKLSWIGSAEVGPTWNVYRDPTRDPSGWGGPLATGVTDEDAGTAGVQYTDVGGVAAGAIQYYLATEVTCAESPL